MTKGALSAKTAKLMVFKLVNAAALASCGLIGHRVWLNEVAAPQRVGRYPDLPRRMINQPFNDISRFRPPSTAVSINWRC